VWTLSAPIMAGWAAWTDGSSYGNPGPAGYGYRLDRGKKTVAFGFSPLGVSTNNAAEYAGVEAALLKILELEEEPKKATVIVHTDSELVVKQLDGRYSIRAKGLKPYHKRLKVAAGKFRKVKFVHIPREKNEVADFLANQGSILAKRNEIQFANHSNG
jgi:ribonuclease HI